MCPSFDRRFSTILVRLHASPSVNGNGSPSFLHTEWFVSAHLRTLNMVLPACTQMAPHTLATNLLV